MSTSDETEYRQARFQPPPGATELWLVRHGESEPARPGAPFPLVDGQGEPARSCFHVDHMAECEFQRRGHFMGVGNPIGILRSLECHAPRKHAQKTRQEQGSGDACLDQLP